MTHIDLFSGIGGFALATEMVWDNVEHVFCDNDEFCKVILKKHWPKSPIYSDIRELVADTEQSGARMETQNTSGQEWRDSQAPQSKVVRQGNGKVNAERTLTGINPFILTGGFPCQPFSQAGRRKGTEDDRYLWPEMFAVIRNTKPKWVIAENVGGFVTWNEGMVLETVCTDLESEGYEVQPFIIPAVSKGAPHRRDRVWIVAYSNTDKRHQEKPQSTSQESKEKIKDRQSNNTTGQPTGTATDLRADRKPDRHEQDATNTRRNTERGEKQRGDGKRTHDKLTGCSEAHDTNTKKFWQGRNEEREGQRGQPNRNGSYKGADWSQNWPEVAAELCTLDDGLPNGLPRPRGWRNAALKATGNAIVPQVAAEIMLAIKDTKV